MKNYTNLERNRLLPIVPFQLDLRFRILVELQIPQALEDLTVDDGWIVRPTPDNMIL